MVRGGELATFTCWLPKLYCRVEESKATPEVTPVPLTVTLCGLVSASSVRVKEAERPPTSEGVNLALMVQLSPSATVWPEQPSEVRAKSPALVPLSAAEATCRSPMPGLLTVRVCSGPVVPTTSGPSAKGDGSKATAGLVPVPWRGRLCGLWLASSAMERAALRSPVSEGVKVTLMLQLPRGRMVWLAQVSASSQSPGWLPPRVRVPTCRSAVPLLVRVTGGPSMERVLTCVSETLEGLSVTTGATASAMRA